MGSTSIANSLRWTIFIYAVVLVQKSASSPILLVTNTYSDGKSYFRCVSEPNNTHKPMSIVTNKYEFVSGVTKYYSPNKSSSPLNCNFETDRCGYYVDNWYRSNSLSNKPFLIDDERWEGLKEFYSVDSFKYTNVQLNNISNLSISVRTEGNVHVALCDDDKIVRWTTSCYWFIIDGGAETNKFSGLRKCRRNIVAKNYPDGDCPVYLKEKFNIPLTKKDVWNTVTIGIEQYSKNYMILSLVSGKGQLVFNHVDDENLIDAKYVLVKAADKRSAVWKFHQTFYLYTTFSNQYIRSSALNLSQNELCISLFVLLCHTCGIEIFLVKSNGERQFLYKISVQEPFVWFREKIIIRKTFYPSEDIYIEFESTLSEYASNPFWAVDEIRECADNEIKILEKTYYENENTKCQLGEETSSFLKNILRSPYKCPSGYIGDSCSVRCADIMGEDFRLCNNTAICSTNDCYCSSGFNGKYCKKECMKKELPTCDFSCHNNCIHCNYFNRTCDECKIGYELPDCEQKSRLISKMYPEVTDIGYDFLQVRIFYESDVTDETRKRSKFSYYYIQYKRADDRQWKNLSHKYGLYENPKIKIESLSFGTFYNIRAVLCNDEDNCYEDDGLRVVIQSTACEDINIGKITDDLNEEESRTKVVIPIVKTDKACPSDRYYLYINGNQVSLGNSNIFFDESPYTNVDIILKKYDDEIISNTSYMTQEGRSSKVRNLNLVAKETEIIMKWDTPENVNGKLLGYTVEYQLTGLQGCTEKLTIVEQKEYNTVYSSFTLTDLRPFARYKISITPFSSKKGHTEIDFIETLPSETSNEILFNESMVTGNLPTMTQANMFVTLKWSLPTDCRQIHGTIYYDIKVMNVWNNDEINISVNKEVLDYTIKDLEPFTNYTAIIYTKRPGKVRNEKPALVYNFTTKPWNPRAVRQFETYGQTENALYLRWKQPFPPNGILEKYHLTVHCGSAFRIPREYDIERDSTCDLWKEYSCFGVTNLTGKYTYDIKIKAKNVDTDYGEKNEINIRAELKKPSKPVNTSANFNSKTKSLSVTWEHPFYNSPVYTFTCKICTNISKCITYVHKVMDKHSTDLKIEKNYTVMFSDINYATTYEIYIHGSNEIEGDETSFQFDTNPPIPQFEHYPSIKTYSNTTVTIFIPALHPSYTFSKNKLIIITEIQNVARESEQITEEMKEMTEMKEMKEKYGIVGLDLTNFRVVGEIVPTYEKTNFILGEVSTTLPENLPVDLTRNINIMFILMSIYKNKTSYTLYTLNKTPNGNWIIGNDATIEPEKAKHELFALLILLIIVPVVIFFLLKKKKSMEREKKIRASSGFTENTGTSRNANVTLSSSKEQQLPTNKAESLKLKPRKDLPTYEVVNGKNTVSNEPKPSSTLIKISDLKEYVKTALAASELERQHKSFPKGKTKPWDYGMTPQNKSKNRYGNLIAYDETRVILDKLPNDPFSDYINANYISGYRAKKAYIATQGPKEKTVNDFWRMVWQENSKYIVMLCNVIENEKKKCEEYWPPVNENKEFGNINVYHTSTQVFADYICRTFKLKREEKGRTVLQFHFISWPDHGVPLYPKSLVPLLKRIAVVPLDPPIIVHCSAGVGRTGTVLLCDICLRMAAHEGAVDILKYQKLIREQRPNMVDNADQFRLVHLILIECLLMEPTSIVCDDNLEYKINELISSNGIKRQINIIKEFSWMDNVMRPTTSSNITHNTKNRFNEIVPDGFARVFISRFPLDDEFSDYINAVYVDGFRQKDRFIVTQQPLPNTLGDFWRMVAEKGVHVIVSLNTLDLDDETLIPIYPENKTKFLPVPYLKIKLINIEDHGFYNITTVVMLQISNDTDNGTREVIHIIEVKDWSAECIVPKEKETDLVDLWENVNKMIKDKNPVVVTCYDGVTASGLFVTLAFVIEKIKLEQDCDVCLAVRTIRHNRENFMEKVEQFEYIYRAAIIYVQSFQLYSNFKAKQK